MSLIRRILFVLPIAMVAASCSASDTLATVDGNDITRGDLEALRPSYTETPPPNAEQLRSDLTLLIVVETEQSAAKTQFGYEPTDADIEERLASPPDRYASVIVSPDQLPDVTEEAIKVNAIETLIRDAVVPELAEAEAQGFDVLLEDRPGDVSRSCVRHISTPTVEEAEAVLARLAAGEDFATVATEVSTDQSSPGGAVIDSAGECLVWLSRAGPEISYLAATAPLNQPVGPISANGQWEILIVEDRVAPSSAEDLAADPMEYLDPDYVAFLYTPWLNDALQEADIDVSPTVGRWSEAGVGIVPPGE
jgi:peptidyl-prolyl cis-trans isomerase C